MKYRQINNKIIYFIIIIILLTGCKGEPRYEGVVFSEKMLSICKKQHGFAIISLDTLIDCEWDMVYQYVGEYENNEGIGREIGDKSYFNFFDTDPYMVRRLVFVNKGKIQKHLDLPWREAATYEKQKLRVAVYFKTMKCAKKDAIFTAEMENLYGNQQGIDISLFPIMTSLTDSSSFASTPSHRKKELKAILWKVYPDSMAKYGDKLK
jgi:hypothetical protein